MLTATTKPKPRSLGTIEYPKDTRRFNLNLSYAELEILLQATHNSNAKLIAADDEPAVNTCSRIRNKVADLLDQADAARATKSKK